MRITIISFFFLLTITSSAQTNAYLADLTSLRSILERTASYKDQIKGDKLNAYKDLYNHLTLDTITNLNSYHYFYNLAQLFFPLRDNHLGFYQIPNYDNFKTKQRIDSFVTTKEFLDYPTIKINIDSLKKTLINKPIESVEGVYHYDKFYSVGLFKRSDKEYIGVVVDSDINLWQKGQIAIHLYEQEPNLFKAIYGHPLFKNFSLQTIEKYRNRSLVNSYFYGSYSQSIYSKQLNQIDHVNLPKSNSKFILKNITDTIQYLLIQTFQRNDATVLKSKNFYDSIKNSLTAPYLILDLRNNEGGAVQETLKYFSLVKEYVSKGQVYVLLNNQSLSQAEIFTLKLKTLKNIITVGQTTKGMLAYGSNYGKRERLPSGRFEVYPTDMKGETALLRFEDYGINPDIYLNENSDWIEQVVALIKKN